MQKQRSGLLGLGIVLAMAGLLSVSCEDDDLPEICKEECALAERCSVETDRLFSRHECENSCRISQQKLASAGCQDAYTEAQACIATELDEDERCHVYGDAYIEALESCEDTYNDLEDCMMDFEEGNLDFSSPTNGLVAQCKRYCDKARECDETGTITEVVLQACYDACEAAGRDTGVAVNSDIIGCVDEPTCDDFAECVTQVAG